MKRARFWIVTRVINRKPPERQYVTRWEEIKFFLEVAEAIASLSGAGFCAIVAQPKDVWQRVVDDSRIGRDTTSAVVRS